MKINDSNYINMLKRKKEVALEFTVHKYLPLVKGIVYKTLASIESQELIEECINDIFFSIWSNIDKFKGEEEDFKKWICAIAKFKSIDCYRKTIKNREILSNDIIDKEEISAEDEFIVNEDREEVMKLINTLDDYDKKIFIMKFFLMFKSDDIAKRLGVTKASVDNRIYRSKKRLRELRCNVEMEGI